ncbi:MAG: esterase-like activity of phytase family protein [Saprospiraceae bacterium]|nr:esterase-like activity of phytase family protein [Saprospiraceae bacterium]
MRYRLLLIIMCFWWTGQVQGQTGPELTHLASHETGTEAAAETVAFDPGSSRVFFTNSAANQLGILDLSNPAFPVVVSNIDLSPYGAAPNSVDIANGLVAVAIQANPKTSPGVIAFFDTNGNFLGQRTVGALPDMVVFTPDGQKVLVANEGEPDDDYLIDPVGSVSIIDVSGGIPNAPVATASFFSYNDKAESLRNKGIRLFGPNASVAQDLEPEYITFTGDGSRAYVSCQEANALAVIDIATATVLDILPLGYKDHMNGNPVLNSFILNELTPFPILGTPPYDGGQDPVYLGGFSGMWFDAAASSPSQWIFYTVPDRGPNGDPVAKATVTPPAAGDLRPYKLPDYQARIVKFTVNPGTQSVAIDDQILLVGKDGLTPISGKGNIPGFDEVPVTYADPATVWATVDYTDPNGEEFTELPYDPMGGDMEGIIRDNQGNFWLCDENRPALYKVQPNGTLIERYVPEGTSLLGTVPRPAGTYGVETLPSLYSNRRANRGFEAIVFDPIKNIVYAFIQSPIENPGSSVRNKTDVIRILGVDAATGIPVEEYVYLLERNQFAGISTSRVDKIGDAVWVGPNRFLVIERDSEGPGVTEGKKFIFEINLTGAVNIFGTELARRDGFTTQVVKLLSGSAPVTDESTTPFMMPTEFTQTLIVDRNTANNDPDFAATFGNWDMITLDPSNRYVFIPAETGTGAGLTRYDRQTGDFVTALTGDDSGNFETDPRWKPCVNEDFGALDPAQWTPWGTVLTAEEWSGAGRMFEWKNPTMNAGEQPEVIWLDRIPSVSHEGVKFDADGILYFIDENNSGSLYKFVPAVAADLTRGQTFVLVVDAFNGDASANWDAAANSGQPRTGAATWVPITDINGHATTIADPFYYHLTDRGGRAAADEVNGTPYGRPEDLEIIGNRLFCPITSENGVLAVDLLSATTANVQWFLNRNTIDLSTGAAVGPDLRSPDNVASDANGTLFVIEDNEPGDIWKTFDANNDGVAESMVRWASLGAPGAEPTGLIATNNPNEFLVCIQHPTSGNDAIWKITEDPNATLLDQSANLEARDPFILPEGFTQTLIVDRNTADKDPDVAATFGNWDMVTPDPAGQYVFIPHEVGQGAGLTRYDIQTGDFVTAMKGNNSGVFTSDPLQWDVNNDDFGALDPAQWTPWNTVLTAEEWSGNGRLFEWTNPLMNASATPNVVWHTSIPSVSHEGLKFGSDGTLYFIDENTSGSVYKFVPQTVGDLSSGQTFVLSVDAYAGNPAANWDEAANAGAIRTGAATWVAITDLAGTATTTADPFNYTNRGGRLAADEVNGTPYGRPEDLEIIGDRLYFTATSEHTAFVIDLNGAVASVRVFANQATTDEATMAAAGSDLRNPDNLASDAAGNIYIIEDNIPGDIWKATDADQDGVAESIVRWASLSVAGAEPTGLIATANPNEFLVCIQHPNSGNDALWLITADPNTTTLLDKSATVIGEDDQPFLTPATFTQTEVLDRNTANLDPDFAPTFGNWDMIALDPTNQYIFIPLEVGTGAGLTRFDTQSGDLVTAMDGDNSGRFATDPVWNACQGGDYGALDPAEWTPLGTVITAEEWSGVGRMFEWMNPMMEAGEEAQVRWLSNIPSVSHEGLKFDAAGSMYFIDENNSGSVYKFVPADANDLSSGQVFVLAVDAYTGNPAANWNDASNTGATRFGPATWVPITDENNNALTAANPFTYHATDRGGRLAADEVNGTPYGRPEDLELVNGRLYCAVTSENTVLSIELISETKANVGILVDGNTLDSGTGMAVDTDLANPDNLASDSRGNIYVIEDNNPGDIWMVRDVDNDGQAESMARFASLGVAGSEPTGFIKTNHPDQFLVCIQHPTSGNDALWMITGGDTLRVATNNKTLEQHSADELFAAGVRPVHKNKVVNLPTLGYESSDKAEGIALLPGNRIALLNDNDFGLAGAGVTDNSVLGLISFDGMSGMDPSDKDGKEEIVVVPTWGMYMPDAIATATINGKDYIITANEGDSRDYDGYSEEERVKDLVLDADTYPDAANLQKDEAIGRLKTTSANGDFDQDGDVDQIYSYGGRSFSIFDAYGNIVFDSGDQFGRKTLMEEPDLFNEDGGKMDSRSDDKGVEPEAVAVGVIDGKTYAFVGFERQSAIVAYDISDPWSPEFVTWYSHRQVDANGDITGDFSPEIIKFVSASDSPNGENLLIVGYEVSGSVGIIQVGGEISAIDTETQKLALFKTWPNPTVSTLNTDKAVTGQIVDMSGRVVANFQNATAIDVRAIEPGVYLIHTLDHGIRRFLKL